ncbi:hypothetical protein COO60DRAFT_266135 [Scenedesmus sp. NREL 46B-D3]|nr:hypothetical protein COO60DRAFT_266135 [Scenedesmus sp. NREL 46B-D3]
MYSALLPASVHLTRLHLCWDQGCLLPIHCWEHVFAAGWQLPLLEQLWIGLPDSMWDNEDVSDLEIVDSVAYLEPCLGGSELRHLVQCCLVLEFLSIPGVVRPGLGVSHLTALTALTGLFVGGGVVDDNAASTALAQLTGLRRLQVHAGPGMTDQGLLAMSALRSLTRLGAWDCGISSAVADQDITITIVGFETQGTEVPDVWLQVLARCTRSEDCQVDAINGLVALTTAQELAIAEQCKALTTSLRLQLEAKQKAAQIMLLQQDILASMQAQLDTAQAAVAVVKQQLGASQAQLVAAEARAAGLEQQLAAEQAELAVIQEQVAAAQAQPSS